MKYLATCFLLLVMFTSCDSLIDNTDLTNEKYSEVSNGLLSDIAYDLSATDSDSIRQFAWEVFQNRNGNKWEIRWDEQSGLPKTIHNGLSRSYPGSAEEAARSFLNDNRELFSFKNNLSDFKHAETKENRGVQHVTFQQFYKEVPVEGAQYKVHVQANGKVDMANGNYFPEIDVSVTPSISSTQALEVAKNDLNLHNPSEETNSTDLVIYSLNDGSLRLAWKTVIFVQKPFTDWLYYIDAQTGMVIEKYNRVLEVTGRGWVYPTHPNISNALKTDLFRLNGNGYLNGTYVNVLNHEISEVYKSNHDFNVSTSSLHFEEVNMYYHVDNFRHNFIEGLSSNTIGIINATVHDNNTCPNNACYSTGTGDIYFSNNFDFAREDKVIHHEYSHAVVHDINSDLFSNNDEEGAINEGVPDYFAGAFTQRSQIGEFCCADMGADRDMANPQFNHYDDLPRNPLTNDVNAPAHVGGEFFSSILWDLTNSGLGSNTDFLVFDALNRISSNPDFFEFRSAMMAADDAAYGGSNNDVIQNTFADRGVGAHVPAMTVNISGPRKLSPEQEGSWSADVSGDHPPYSYQWEKDGVNVGTNSTYSYRPYSSEAGTMFQLSLTVTDSENNSMNKTANVLVDIR